MDDIPLSWLFTALFLLLLCSAFFSSSETSMMALNRYRLKHLNAIGHRGARKASRLLKRSDRLIGLILIGNNLVNIAAASLATVICVRMFGGDAGPWIATAALTVIVLIFAEVTPKTYAALHPEKLAFNFAYVLQPLQTMFYPLIVVTNAVTNTIVKMLGGDPENPKDDSISHEELKALVKESGENIPPKRRGMLMNILDLENHEVEDIMIPRDEIYAIDVNDSAEAIFDKIRASEYTRVLVYRDELDDLVGLLHLRNTSRFIHHSSNNTEEILDKRALIEATVEPYFIPQATPLHIQLMNFQEQKRRIGIVVDEYGVVEGLVALEDILEEIVGNFTTNFAEQFADIHPLSDGKFSITGSATIRDINRELGWELPTETAKTLNGLILEHLDSFPDASGVSVVIGDYLMEIAELKENRIVSVLASQPPAELD